MNNQVGRLVGTLALVAAAGVSLGACSGSSRGDDDVHAGAGKQNGSGGSSAGGGKGGHSGSGGKAVGAGGSGVGGQGTGASATGGDAGSSESGAGAPSGYVNLIRASGVDKVDVLIMIDNSPSMGAKQELLAEAIPYLAQRLITPSCIDASGKANGKISDASGHCSSGAPEFNPVRDMHVGIVTSSLGDHGSNDICSDAQNTENVAQGMAASNYNDRAELLPSVRNDLSSWDNSGFLVWDPRDQANVADPHPGLGTNETNLSAFVSTLKNQAQAAGERGCGYESSLEAWYRFLVDPEPVTSVSRDPSSSTSQRGTVNQVVLDQRQRFLRPDSLLVVLMLTDENDCSVLDEDGSQGWLVGYKGGVDAAGTWHMPRASSACATNPNDKCCHNCLSAAPAGCPSNDSDSACSLGTTLTANEDSMNLRCFQQVQRFGVSLLYPTDRYVEALTKRLVTPRFGGPQVENPIFAAPAGAVPRDPAQVIPVGILGVPWQDLATEASWSGDHLEYLDATGLEREGRWDVMLGDPKNNVLPTDTLMVESVNERTNGYPQKHPLIDATIAPSSSTALTNPINGHERGVHATRDELQYSCIFPLAAPIACNSANSGGCDCLQENYDINSPICQGVTLDMDGSQTYGKAYPSLRELAVLKAVGDTAVVASICAKNVEADDPTGDPDFGYHPAISALVNKVKGIFTPKCLAQALPVSQPGAGKTDCSVFEARAAGGCDCSQNGRVDAPAGASETVARYLTSLGVCSNGQTCDDLCVCEVAQLSGDALASCQAGDSDTGQGYGFCYIDPAAGLGSDAAVAECDSSEKWRLRFMGDGVPAPGSYAIISCAGDP